MGIQDFKKRLAAWLQSDANNSTAPQEPAANPGFFEHLKLLGFDPKTIIDVGVANGTPALYAAFPNAYYVLVEAVAEYEQGIRNLLNGLDGEYHLVAVSDHAGQMEMMVREPLYISSLNYDANDLKSDTRTVDVKRLDQIITRDLAGPALIKTDCQGHDLDVIRGATGLLDRVEVCILEIPMHGPWGGGNEFIDYVTTMDTLGFRFYDVWGSLRRPSDHQLHSIDGVFVRTDGLLRKHRLFTEGKLNLGYFGEHYCG